MGMDARAVKRAILIHGGPAIIALLLRLLHLTIRWTYVDADKGSACRGPVLFSFFHGRMLMLPFAYDRLRRGRRIRMIQSPHFDGQLASRIIARFGIGSIWGSSSKKSLQLLKSIAVLTDCDIGITPDGPRGPGGKVKEGVVFIGRMKGYPILPVVYSVKRAKILDTWDRFMVPVPFTKGVYLCGSPITIPADAGRDEYKHWAETIEAEMNALTERADRLAREL